MKKQIWIISLMLILGTMTVLAGECGSTPSADCTFSVSTTISNGTYDDTPFDINTSNIVIDAESDVTISLDTLSITNEATNITLDGFTIGLKGDIELRAHDLTINDMTFNEDGEVSYIAFVGDNLVVTNSAIDLTGGGGTIAFEGDNVRIDGNNIATNGGLIGITDPSLGYANFSGQFINNCFAGSLAIDSYSGDINITGNTVGGYDNVGDGGCYLSDLSTNFFVSEDASGDVFFYDNNFFGFDTWIDDYTDYPTYAVTWCVGCTGNTGVNYFGDAGDPLAGTCCAEDWTEDDYTCPVEEEYTSTYTEGNSCDNYFDTYYTGYCDLPAQNGTTQNCTYTWSPTHETSDISGLVIDGGVELGVQYIRFVGLIALVGIGIWALNMLP